MSSSTSNLRWVEMNEIIFIFVFISRFVWNRDRRPFSEGWSSRPDDFGSSKNYLAKYSCINILEEKLKIMIIRPTELAAFCSQHWTRGGLSCAVMWNLFWGCQSIYFDIFLFISYIQKYPARLIVRTFYLGFQVCLGVGTSWCDGLR